MPLIDSDLHLLPMIAQSTPDIAPVGPESWKALRVPGERSGLLLYTSGNMDATKTRYPGVLWCPGSNGRATPRPILPNSGKVALCFGMMASTDTLDNANVIETDLLIVTGGMKYNCSGQRHVSDGQIDIGNWTNTGIKVGAIVPNHRYEVRWSYSFDTAKHVCSVLSYEADGALFPITLPPMSATPSNWQEGAYLQLQLGSLPKCQEWSVLFDSVRLVWE